MDNKQPDIIDAFFYAAQQKIVEIQNNPSAHGGLTTKDIQDANESLVKLYSMGCTHDL